MQPRAHPQLPAAMQHQPVGSGQKQFEEDEEVEQIAGQESAVQTHQQELEQAVKMRPLPVPARRGIDQRGQRQRRGQHQHQRREPVVHQNDAPGRDPVAQPVKPQFGAARPVILGARQKLDRAQQRHQRRGQADRQLRAPLPVVIDQHQRRREKRDQDRRDDQMLGAGDHASGSLPSTWSLPVSPRAAISSTRNSAVAAKPMTIAVRTSACGSGSA